MRWLDAPDEATARLRVTWPDGTTHTLTVPMAADAEPATVE
ncbi:MAG: hypothetical protein ACOC3G_05305 [Phycisphaeraceae bacterium]